MSDAPLNNRDLREHRSRGRTADGLDVRHPGRRRPNHRGDPLVFAVSAGLVWIRRDDRKPLAMVARMGVLWSSFGYAWVIGYGELLSWFADTTSIAGGASLVAGAAVHMGRQA